jgi:hypothetical protein
MLALLLARRCAWGGIIFRVAEIRFAAVYRMFAKPRVPFIPPSKKFQPGFVYFFLFYLHVANLSVTLDSQQR